MFAFFIFIFYNLLMTDKKIEMNNKLDEIWEYSDDDIRLHKIFNLKLKSSMEKHNIDEVIEQNP